MGHPWTNTKLEPAYISIRSLRPPMLSARSDRHRLKAWQTSLCFYTALAGLVLAINSAVTIWIALSFPRPDGIPTLIEGDCSRVSVYDTWVHLGINVLNVLLLSGSNYTMQCLVAPTRSEIDRAHARGSWLDIGVPSLRNLKSIQRMRMIAWFLLGLTTIPFALMWVTTLLPFVLQARYYVTKTMTRYNSLVFKAVDSTDYNVMIVNEAFITGAPFALKQSSRFAKDFEPGFEAWADILGRTQSTASSFTPLNNSECIEEYGEGVLSKRRTVLLMTNEDGDRPSARASGSLKSFQKVLVNENPSFRAFPDPRLWMCSSDTNALHQPTLDPYREEQCVTDRLDPATWKVNDYIITGCRSERVDQHCRLEFSIQIAITIIICNAIKLIIMTLAILKFDHDTLCTLGDAIASFLTYPIETDVLEKPRPVDDAYGVRRRSAFWLRAPGRGRQYTFAVASIAMLATVAGLLGHALETFTSLGLQTDFKSLWTFGFGRVSTSALISDSLADYTSVVQNVLLANLPQAILSLLYLLYNSIYTCMVMEQEFQAFAYVRKTLRVSAPGPTQRSTYFLQLPYRYAVPLIAVSGLMHWLISQSFFLAHILAYRSDGTRASDFDLLTCGYSPIAMICVLIVGLLMVLCLVITSFRKYRPGMPLARNRSNAIKAACNRLLEDDQASTSALQWGLVYEKEGTKRYAFSSFEVGEPLIDKIRPEF